METRTEALSVETLLQHGAWMRALAGHLVHDAATVDDVVQDAWVAALRSPPDPARSPRPWLAQVLRNLVRSRVRHGTRRRAREEAAGAAQTAPPSAEEVLARTQLHQGIAALMTSLEEPYRTTLLLRFHEERDSVEIGELCGVPPATVRWRIAEGLRRLREGLDARYGERRTWTVLLLPTAGPRPNQALALEPAARGLPGAKLAGAAALVLAGGAAITLALWPRQPPSRPEGSAPPPSAAVQPQPSEENDMTKQAAAKHLRPFVAALPLLVASSQAQADASPLFEEAVTMCVEMRERVFECKAEFAESFVAQRNPPPEQRKALIKKALEEITADGSGPLEPRRDRCRVTTKNMQGGPQDEATKRGKLDGMKKVLAFCSAKENCAERVECMKAFFKPGAGKATAPRK